MITQTLNNQSYNTPNSSSIDTRRTFIYIIGNIQYKKIIDDNGFVLFSTPLYSILNTICKELGIVYLW